MKDHERTPGLPFVTPDDILAAFTDEALRDTPDHTAWHEFAAAQPHLARSILERAIFLLPTQAGEVVDARKATIDAVSFAIRALARANDREQRTNGDGDAAIPRP